jgi:hypothetical protein
MITTNATLQSNTHRFFRENKRGRRESDHQEEFLGRRGRMKVNGRSKPPTNLFLNGQAWGEIPVKESFHGRRSDLVAMRGVRGGGGRERHLGMNLNKQTQIHCWNFCGCSGGLDRDDMSEARRRGLKKEEDEYL